MSGRFLSLMCFAWHHSRRVGHCRWGIFIVTVHKRRFICAVSKEKEDSCFALQQHLFSSSARCGGWFMHFSLGKWAENGCTLFSENSKSRFFPLKLFKTCCGKNWFHLAHQQGCSGTTQLFCRTAVLTHHSPIAALIEVIWMTRKVWGRVGGVLSLHTWSDVCRPF